MCVLRDRHRRGADTGERAEHRRGCLQWMWEPAEGDLHRGLSAEGDRKGSILVYQSHKYADTGERAEHRIRSILLLL